MDQKAEKERERQEDKQRAKDELRLASKKREIALKHKFESMDHSKRQVDQSINNYKRSLKELNMYKHIDQDENMQRLRRGRSAYREKLAKQIVQKGQRAAQISSKKH